MKTPVKVGIIAMAANMVMNVVFVLPLHFYFQWGHVGLALATSCSAFLNAGILLLGLRRREIYMPRPGWMRLGLQIIAANTMMVMTLWWLVQEWCAWVAWDWLLRTGCLAFICGLGLLIYVITLMMMGIRLSAFVMQSAKK